MQRQNITTNFGNKATLNGGGFSSASANFQITAQLTLACWFRETSNPSNGNGILMGKYDEVALLTGYVLYWDQGVSGKMKFITGNGTNFTLTGTGTYALNKTYFVAGVYDGTRMMLYIGENGILRQSASMAGPASITSHANAFKVGVSTNGYVVGYMASPLVVARGLSEAELLGIYMAGPNNIEIPADTKGYYKFASDGTDSSGQGNTLTVASANGTPSFAALGATDINRDILRTLV